MAYQKISLLFNKEKVLGKENWRNSIIFTILQNEVYKGTFVHEKRTKKPRSYHNIVKPIISQFINNTIEYDLVVNQFFLLIMKQKIRNPIK